MKQATILFVSVILCISGSYAQYYTNQNKVWAFGHYAGIKFTSGVPVPFRSSIYTSEGSASVSDTAGNLLFYTDGRKVFNRAGAVMPAGDSIVHFEVISTTQAAAIVPVINNANQYYIFSLEQGANNSGACRLAYSIIDMTLAGGFGDIVPGASGIIIDSQLTEKMTTVPGDSSNIWLLVQKKDTLTFKAYNITVAGIGSAVITAFDTPVIYGNVWGSIACSPDRRKIVTQNANIGTVLYSFDPRTGVVSNRQILDDSIMHICYSAEFSPDSKKVYSGYELSYTKSLKIVQYDISLPNTAAIRASMTLIASGSHNITHLKLGPDNKIYLNRVSDITSSYMDIINYPNLPGTGCGYVSHALALFPGTLGVFGLPNIYVSPVKSLEVTPVSLDDVNLFPNPADQQFTVTLSSTPHSTATISIYDISGNRLNTYNIANAPTTISTSNLPAGIYQCKIEIEGKAVVYKKLIIAR